MGQRLDRTGTVLQMLVAISFVHFNNDGHLRVKMQPLPAASVIPPLLIVKLAGVRPPPILFCPSDSCPIVPDSPPDAVRPKEQVDRGTVRAETPAIRDKVASVYIL